jgi:subtilase family serine protease
MFRRLIPVAAVPALALALSAAARATVPIDVGTLAGLRDLGRAPASTSVRVAVVLRYHHDAELERLVEAQADPESTLYHRFLSTGQFAAYFSPTRVEYARVARALQRGGFTIAHTFANRTVVDATAPAPIAARYFSTEIHRVLAPDVRSTYTNVRAGSVPDEIGELVLAVVGLDAANRLVPAYVLPPIGAPHPVRPNVQWNRKPVFGPDGGYGPQVYVNSYDLPAASGKTGTGRASGVATDADFLDSDLAGYLKYFGVKRTGPATTRVLVNGGPPPGLSTDSIETTLDVETIVSIAPGTALYVYEAPYDEPTNSNFIDIFNKVVTDNKVDTLNSSYIYCETAMQKMFHGYPKALDAVEKQGGALGITFHAASGDSAANSPGCYSTVSVGVPSSTPHNIAVGGTTLSVDTGGHETGEIGWGGTGGGVSAIFKVPTYQKGVPHVISTGRNVPDLAFDADPGTGESYYYSGGFVGPIGGTSLACPIFGATLTEINQVLNSRAGFFNVTLYKTWLAHGYGSGSKLYFRDITQGSIPPYHAGPGYDQMSGIGAMRATTFASLLH